MPTAACPACGGELRPWRRAPDHEPASRATHLLLRCAGGCGSAVTAGPAPAPEAHATGAYRPGAPVGASVAAPLLRAFDRRRLALVEEGRPPVRRLLDVGAGRGRFVAFARARGWDATGIEPSPREPAPWVAPVGVEDAPVAAGSLHAITAWHVLEHVEDPGRQLARMRGWLAPGGVILLGVPNLESVQARVGGPRWYHLDLPRHRTHFSATGIETLVRRSGLDLVRTEHRLLEHNPFGMWQSAVSRATPTQSWLYHALKRNAPARPADVALSVAALGLAPVAAGAEHVAARRRRGGTVAILARRPPDRG